MPQFEHLPVSPRRPDLVRNDQAPLALVPEPVDLARPHRDTLAGSEEAFLAADPEAHPSLLHHERLGQDRVPVRTGHRSRPRPDVLAAQEPAGPVRSLAQDPNSMSVPVNHGAVPDVCNVVLRKLAAVHRNAPLHRLPSYTN